MRKPTICIGENKGADRLRSTCEADQRLCFRYMDSKIPLFSKNQNFQPLTIFCDRDCTAWFVSDLVGTQIVGFLSQRLTCEQNTFYEKLRHQIDDSEFSCMIQLVSIYLLNKKMTLFSY